MHLDELCQTDTHLPDGTDWHVQNCGECWKMDFSDCFNVFECRGTQKYLLLCLHLNLFSLQGQNFDPTYIY